uniref:Uncharacterized protein n=1 Tax=Clytia hemisphaerica TaxID=252671 RepID=A0A7M5VDC9_9CNID
MERFKTSSEQNEAIKNFINNLSDVEVDDNIDEGSSDDDFDNDDYNPGAGNQDEYRRSDVSSDEESLLDTDKERLTSDSNSESDGEVSMSSLPSSPVIPKTPSPTPSSKSSELLTDPSDIERTPPLSPTSSLPDKPGSPPPSSPTSSLPDIPRSSPPKEKDSDFSDCEFIEETNTQINTNKKERVTRSTYNQANAETSACRDPDPKDGATASRGRVGRGGGRAGRRGGRRAGRSGR